MPHPKLPNPSVITDEFIVNTIHLFRDQKVILDEDLAKLYQVETKQLKRQIKRNIERFPEDFMFELNKEELENLRSQSGTSSWGGTRYIPMAFTEQGVAMPARLGHSGGLSSVLNSPTAIKVNIQIIRVFTKMRALLMSNKDILLQLEKVERKLSKQDEDITLIFQHLKKLLTPPPQPPRQPIGFRKD